MGTQPQRILFVCMGNICRSPIAEGIFLHHANARGVARQFDVDSAGTGGWHAGESPDPRALAIAEQRGVRLVSRARQISPRDFTSFDHLICMDRDNRANLLEMGAPDDRTRLMLEYHSSSDHTDVPDPYYGGDDGFTLVFNLLDDACRGLLDHLLEAPATS